MKNDYGTLSETIQELKSKGYSEDFNLGEEHIDVLSKKQTVLVDDFEVDAIFRFEGKTNPSDSSILYAISSEKHEMKGLMVDAYGAYSGQLSPKMIQKLRYTA